MSSFYSLHLQSHVITSFHRFLPLLVCCHGTGRQRVLGVEERQQGSNFRLSERGNLCI
jgi:hypothetical protein